MTSLIMRGGDIAPITARNIALAAVIGKSNMVYKIAFKTLCFNRFRNFTTLQIEEC